MAKLNVSGPNARIAKRFSDVIRDEVNVKEVTFEEDATSYGKQKLNLVPGIMAPRLGPEAKKVFAAYKKGEWTLENGVMTVGGIELNADEYNLVLEPSNPQDSRALNDRTTIVSLDLKITPELEREGMARDIVRAIQEARKSLNLNITDRIKVLIVGNQSTKATVEEHRDLISQEVLSDTIEVSMDEMLEDFTVNVEKVAAAT